MPLEMKYFVLKPEAKSTDDHFATASQDAMEIYADSIQEHDPVLASELRAWARNACDIQVRMK